MSRIGASVTLSIEVDDPQQLWDTARGHCVSASDDDAVDMLGERDDPRIGDCLRMIFDPGDSPAGCSIQDSYAEVLS